MEWWILRDKETNEPYLTSCTKLQMPLPVIKQLTGHCNRARLVWRAGRVYIKDRDEIT